MPQNALPANVAISSALVPAPLRLDASNNLKVAVQSSPTAPVSTVSAGNSFKNQAANAATVVVMDGPGVLVGVSINTKGATGNVLTIYDNASAASGTKVGTFDTTAGPAFIPLNARMANGTTISLATGTAADLTFIYRKD